MLSQARILDRGRLLVALLIALPLGALIWTPGRSAGSGDRVEWTAQRVENAAPPATGDTAQPVTAQDIVANLTNGTASSADAPATPVAADEEGEIEGEVTTALPSTYIPGTPPSADLAAVLRASEQRNNLATPPPTAQAGALALVRNPNVQFTRQSQVTDLTSGSIDPRVVDLLTWIAIRHRIMITSLRTDHSVNVAGTARVSAHHLGRAVDIAAVNGQLCTGVPGLECGRLYEEVVNQLRGTQYQPSQIIYGYDLWPAESWNFEMSNHHNHIHIGY